MCQSSHNVKNTACLLQPLVAPTLARLRRGRGECGLSSSAPGRALMLRPLGLPTILAENRRTAGLRRGCSVGNTVGVVTFTGSISATSPAAFSPSNPCRYACRQANTWFAFTWWRRATVATEAPRTCVSSTIRRFSSRVCLCRGPVRRPKASVATASAQVSIWAPRGHLPLCVHLAPHHLPRLLPTPDGLQQALTIARG